VIFYKIRSKSTGKYRCAGGEPKWNSTGKLFDSLGKLRQMIANCMRHNSYMRVTYKNDFSDWEIVEYHVAETSTKAVHEILKPEKVMELLKK